MAAKKEEWRQKVEKAGRAAWRWWLGLKELEKWVWGLVASGLGLWVYYLLTNNPDCNEGIRFSCTGESLNAYTLFSGLVAAVGIRLLVWRSRIAEKQVKTSLEQVAALQEQVDKTHRHNLEDQFIKALGLLDEGNLLSKRLAGVSSLVAIGAREPEEFGQRCVDALCEFNEWMRNEDSPEVQKWKNKWNKLRLIGKNSRKERTSQEILSQPILFNIRSMAQRKRKKKALPLNFTTKCLNGANFMQSYLEGTELPGALLKGARFVEASLSEANFRSAHLEGADFRNAHIDDAVFSYASLKEVNFQEAHSERINFWGASIEGAKFGKARLKVARFSATHLEGSDFREAQLEDAFFTDASLKNTNFQGAYLEGAWFSPSSLEEDSFRRAISQAQLGGGVFVVVYSKIEEEELASLKAPEGCKWLSKNDKNALYEKARKRAPSGTIVGLPDSFIFRAFKRKDKGDDKDNNETTGADDA